jgi:hypothetical protein
LPGSARPVARPWHLIDVPGPDLMAAFEAELEEERATALGDAGRKLETALAELATATPATLDDRLDDAATAVWHFTILRESARMFDHREAYAIYGVPARVLARVGIVKR